MEKLQLWAQPWWVNLLVLIPFVTYFAYRRKGLPLRWRQLIILTIFAAAFGFVEAAVVAYLRAAIGLLPGYMGTFAELRHSSLSYTQASSLSQFPQSLLTIEVYREAATMVMLVGVALLSASRASARWVAFLWVFALWDIAYYAGLWITVRWPASLTDLDVLFLIPAPWVAQVWFPLLISTGTVLVIALSGVRSAPTPAPDGKAAGVGYS